MWDCVIYVTSASLIISINLCFSLVIKSIFGGYLSGLRTKLGGNLIVSIVTEVTNTIKVGDIIKL